MTKCIAKRTDGAPCRARPPEGEQYCRWHNPSEEARAALLEMSRKGGTSKAYGALASTDALDSHPNVAGLDLTTADGLRGLQAANLRALARVPHDARIANSITNAVVAQRTVIDSADLERRVAALEAHQQEPPR